MLFRYRCVGLIYAKTFEKLINMGRLNRLSSIMRDNSLWLFRLVLGSASEASDYHFLNLLYLKNSLHYRYRFEFGNLGI